MKKRGLAVLLALTLALGNLGVSDVAFAANEETMEAPSEPEESEEEQTTDSTDMPENTESDGQEVPEQAETESFPVESESTDSEEAEDAGLEMGNEISVEAETGFGSLLTPYFMEEVTEQQENKGYNVFSIEMSGNVAKVSYESLENATLVVGIYDEAGGEMLASGSTEVSLEETIAVVEIETENMPQYFYVRGFLVETGTFRPLCTVYESPMYTKEMQDFLAKTTADFDADRVLNLDADTANNFAVFKDGIILIPENSGYNEVVTADEANNTYVIANTDENIAALQPGDIFSYHYRENDVLIVKVADINMEGTNATILGEETSLEDVFDYVKIDAQGGSADAVVDASTCVEGVTYEGIVDYVEEGAFQTYADIQGSVSKAFKLSFDKEFGSIEGINVKLSGGLDVKLTFSAKVYFAWGSQYVELKLDYGAKIYASVTGQAKAEIPLITVGFMFSGIIVEMTPSVVLDARANISLEGSLSGTIGFRVQEKKVINLTKVPKFSPSVKIEGSIFFGLSLEPRVKILSEKVVSASLNGMIGAEVSASFKDSSKVEENRRHTCSKCVSGEVNGKFSLKAGLKLVNKWDFNLTILEDTCKILDFYYSADRDEFGLSTCPYYIYRIKATVLSTPFNPIEGATVKGATLDGEYVTDNLGEAAIWLPAGNHTLVFRKDGFQPYTLKMKVPGSDRRPGLFVWLSEKNGQGSGSGSGSENGGEDSGDGEEDGGKKVVQISIGGYNSAAITEDGNLYLWGSNDYGELGNGTNEDSNVPIEIMNNVKEVDLRYNKAAAITEEGDLYLWGKNEYGELGNGTNEDSNVPIKIMSNVKKVGLGYSKTAAITEEGDLYLWGSNNFGQLGNGTNENSNVPIKIMSDVKDVNIEGGDNGAAITEQGDLYLWGYNYYGQLGNGTNEDSNVPIKIMGNVKKVSLVQDYSAAITEEGNLYLWGYNGSYQLGNGTHESSNVPIKIMGNVKEVDLSGAAITEEGDLYLWGYNHYGQLGNGTTQHRYEPFKIMGNVKEVGHGSIHRAAITEDGNLYLWGGNNYGQLGNGTTENSKVPIKITISSKGKRVNDSMLSVQAESPEEENSERITQNWNGSGFTGLISNEIYNYYVLKSKTADQPFASDNLLYIGQAVTDGSGTLNVAFTMQESYVDAEIFAVPMHPTDISGADVTVSDLTYNGERQYAPVSVTRQGIKLTPGEDYYVEGDYGVTEEGDYALTIVGTGYYTGTLTVTYRMLPEIAHFYISGVVKSSGEENETA